jgi:hypothetical protein
MTSGKDKKSGSIWASLFGVREIFSYIASVAVTAVTAWFAIGRRHGTNIAELGGFAKNKRETLEKAVSELVDKQSVTGAGLSASEFRQEFGNRIRTLGAHGNELLKPYIKNPIDKFQVLKTHQKLEVIFESIAVFTVSLGVILSAVKSKELSVLFHHADSKKSQTERG